MVTIRRTFKLFRLNTISLPEDLKWISEIANSGLELSDTLPLPYGHRHHLLFEAKEFNEHLLLVFASFAIGDRPDIINTANMNIESSPLNDYQEFVTYSYALIWKGKSDYLLLLDMIRGGITQGAISKYLHVIFEKLGMNVKIEISPISADEDFFTRVKSLERITSFTIKFKRHDNPGISRAVNVLAEKADEAEAGSVEAVTRSRWGGTLRYDKGIIPWGKEQKETGEAEKLSVTGFLNQKPYSLASDRMDQKYSVTVEVGKNGKPQSTDLFGKLSAVVEEIFF
jgi:hypothetical protein